jgi:hypothetical protein
VIVKEQSPEDEWFLIFWRGMDAIQKEEWVLSMVHEMDLRGRLIEVKRQQIDVLELQLHRAQTAIKSLEVLA